MIHKAAVAAISSILFLTAALPVHATASEPKEAPLVTLSPAGVDNGHLIFVEINTHRDSVSVQLTYADRFIPLSDYPARGQGVYFGLIGIPYYSQEGRAQLTLKWSDARGSYEKALPFQIRMGDYRSEKLKVQTAKASPSKTDMVRIKKEREAVKAVYAGWHYSRLWTEPFTTPLQSMVTSPFGSRRLFNGKTRSYHSGVDFRAAVGTPVFAANAGIVKMARDLFFSGNIVIIDHGMGVFTNYAHLSRMDVKPGQFVNRGEQIGLAGATGRVNGPHLHWGAKVNGVTVNPNDLIQRMPTLYEETDPRMVSNTPQSP
jgi:murein DD-endopeptidase MepM/ murein hydrolase activator NlpD